MRPRRYLSLAATVAILLVAFSARAQNEETGAHAHGIRLGDALVLHLSLGAEVDYDSNIFYESSNAHSAFFLRLNPSFELTTRPREGHRQVEFSAHGGLGYIEYLTSEQAVENHRQFNVDAGLLASFFNLSPYSFSLFDNYVRTSQPPYTVSSGNLDRDTNELGIRVNLSPGGGRLTFYVGYLFGIDYFEPALLQSYDLQDHRFDLRVSWRVLPKTAIYVQATEVINHYPTPGIGMHPDSYPFHVDAGLQGLITAKLTVNLWVGYGNGFYVTGPNPNTAIGGVSATWKPTLLSTGQIGYQHDFINSLLGSYYDEDTAYVSWTQLIWRFTGFLRAQYSNLRFKGVQAVQATTDGTDNMVQLNARVDYPFKEWLFASVGYDLLLDRSDRKLTVGNPSSPMVPQVVPVDYTKHVVYLRLTATY